MASSTQPRKPANQAKEASPPDPVPNRGTEGVLKPVTSYEDCFSAGEFRKLEAERLPEARTSHLKTCTVCRELLELRAPNSALAEIESALAESPQPFLRHVNLKPVMLSCALAIGLPLAAWIYNTQSQQKNLLEYQQAHLLASVEEDLSPLMDAKVANLVRNAEEAVKMKDWKKAEMFYVQATTGASHSTVLWEAAAITCVKQAKHDKSKYDRALELLRSAPLDNRRLIYLACSIEAAKEGLSINENTWVVPVIFGH